MQTTLETLAYSSSLDRQRSTEVERQILKALPTTKVLEMETTLDKEAQDL